MPRGLPHLTTTNSMPPTAAQRPSTEQSLAPSTAAGPFAASAGHRTMLPANGRSASACATGNYRSIRPCRISSKQISTESPRGARLAGYTGCAMSRR